ncbi:MAG: DUF4388 domain-containing protein [Bradymonadaceae bacterium]|nr:DUF4388 domain-containing protein [Lujinxingiaceae bacterium]
MSSTYRVALCEGNATLRRLIIDVLGDANIDVHVLEGPAPLAGGADLLVVDVDSDVDEAQAFTAAFSAAKKPVLVLGLRHSREAYSDFPWLSRPFSGASLVQHCQELLGLAGSQRRPDAQGAEEPPPPPLGIRSQLDEPPTVELGIDDALALEGELGLDPGALARRRKYAKFRDTADELAEVMDFEDDSPMIVDIEDIDSEMMRGGMLISSVQEHFFDDEELENEISLLTSFIGIARPVPTQTLPDAPAVVRGVESAEGSGGVQEGSQGDHSSRRPGSSVSATGLSTDAVQAITVASRMLAESWDRLGLAARTEDRADRIERVLFALFKEGLRGASAAIGRIPPASGLSGSLDALGLMDLFHTMRDRRLRGRLEVCIAENGFVLYVNEGTLEDIDTLGGSTDALLLRILREQGAIDEATFARFARMHEEDDGLSAPLEMRLRGERLVSDADLRQARQMRAREIFRQIFEGRGGNFAFIEIHPGGGQAWPVDGLRLSIDEMLLDIMRADVIETGHSEATARTSLVIDPLRAASLNPSALTQGEREMLMFFREGETLGEAREQFGEAQSDVDRVVNRLKSVELLKRRDPQERVAKAGPVPTKLMFMLDELPAGPVDPHKMQTAVSDWAIPIPDMGRNETTPMDVVSRNREVAGPDEDTYLKQSFAAGAPNDELLPPTGEVDEFASEAEDSDYEP